MIVNLQLSVSGSSCAAVWPRYDNTPQVDSDSNLGTVEPNPNRCGDEWCVSADGRKKNRFVRYICVKLQSNDVTIIARVG